MGIGAGGTWLAKKTAGRLLGAAVGKSASKTECAMETQKLRGRCRHAATASNRREAAGVRERASVRSHAEHGGAPTAGVRLVYLHCRNRTPLQAAPSRVIAITRFCGGNQRSGRVSRNAELRMVARPCSNSANSGPFPFPGRMSFVRLARSITSCSP